MTYYWVLGLDLESQKWKQIGKSRVRYCCFMNFVYCMPNSMKVRAGMLSTVGSLWTACWILETDGSCVFAIVWAKVNSVIEWVQSQKSEAFHVFGDRCSCVVRGGGRARRRTKSILSFHGTENWVGKQSAFLNWLLHICLIIYSYKCYNIMNHGTMRLSEKFDSV